MNRRPPKTCLARNRGSALATVILFSTLIAALVAASLSFSVAERRATRRHAYWLEARAAAEALADYGASAGAHLACAYADGSQAPSFDPAGPNALLSAGSAQLSALQSFLSGDDVDTALRTPDHPTGLQLLAGTPRAVPLSGGTFTVDANDTQNVRFPMATLWGQSVYRYDVPILAQATVVPPDGSLPVTANVVTTLSLLRVPLFNDGVVYLAGDMEVESTQNFTVPGTVRVNGNLWASSQGSVEGPGAKVLLFPGTVSMSGNLYHLWAGQTPAAEGAAFPQSGEPLGGDYVGFTNPQSLVNMPMDSGGSWKDSTLGADAQLLAGGLYDDTVTPASVQANRLVVAPSAFAPAVSALWGNGLLTQAMEVEPAYPCGLHVQIGADASGQALFADPAAIIDPPNGPSNNAPLTTNPAFDPASSAYGPAVLAAEGSKFSRQAGLYLRVTVAHTASGPDTAVVTASTQGGAALGGAPLVLPSGLVTFVPYQAQPVGSSTAVTSGLFDQRQQCGVNLVQIDMSKLALALRAYGAGTPAGAITTPAGTCWQGGLTESDPGWNGGVYVEVSPTSPNQTAVALARGVVAHASTSLLPATNAVQGLSLGTNAPLYILGSFNATGAGRSPTNPDDGIVDTPGGPVSAEIPVALLADAVTVLTAGYFGPPTAAGSAASASNPVSSPAYASYATAAPVGTGNVEIAAAIVTGIVPTSPTSWSGGFTNMIRFVESWSGTLTMRGSFVVGFPSRVASAPFSMRYFKAPALNWGYAANFGCGYQPPLTPRMAYARRSAFAVLPVHATTDASGNPVQGYADLLRSLWPGESF